MKENPCLYFKSPSNKSVDKESNTKNEKISSTVSPEISSNYHTLTATHKKVNNFHRQYECICMEYV